MDEGGGAGVGAVVDRVLKKFAVVAGDGDDRQAEHQPGAAA
ncbi:hypothetical protein ACWCQZ_35750 [Streptomyces sp. NPDC002285]